MSYALTGYVDRFEIRFDSHFEEARFTTMAIDEFNDAQKQQFMAEDSEAWNAICTILLGIISIGLVLACLAVWLIA